MVLSWLYIVNINTVKNITTVTSHYSTNVKLYVFLEYTNNYELVWNIYG